MYTAVLYSDKTWEFVAGLEMNRQGLPDDVRLFGIPKDTTIEAFEEWIVLGMPAEDLFEY